MSPRNAARASARARPGKLAQAIASGEFAAAVEALVGPADGCLLAVAVSGGRDSMALAHLAHRWAQDRGGTVKALIVDHGLRPASGTEAADAAALLAAKGIASEILAWRGAKPGRRIEEQARDARYELLTAWCRQAGAAALLTAHHQGDQAETVAMRLMRGSSLEGLAGISALIERDGVRVARPLLGFARGRLEATLAEAGLGWIDDPSNEDPRFERNRWRARLDGATREALLALSRGFGAERQAIERRIAGWIALHGSVDHYGVASIARADFLALPDALALRALARLVGSVAGRFYPARRQALGQALSALRRGRSTVAGGCRLMVRAKRIVIVRELNAIAPRQPIAAGQTVIWDGRFLVRSPVDGWLGPVGAQAWPAIRSAHGDLNGLAAAGAWALPAIWANNIKESGQMLALPTFLLPTDYGRQGGPPARFLPLDARFCPRHGLSPAKFTLVLPGVAPI